MRGGTADAGRCAPLFACVVVSKGRVYSLDLRTRVLAAAALDRFSCRALAERFSIGERTVRLWCRRHRTTGQVAPPAPRHAGPREIPDATGLPIVRALVAAQPDATLAELAQAGRLAGEHSGDAVSTVAGANHAAKIPARRCPASGIDPSVGPPR